MGRYFDEMSAVIERHGGTVEKFIGDAVMAVFGIPQLHEDDALRAVRAADEMQAALETLNQELERDHGVGLAARIGVNTGEVVAGDPSGGQRLVTGDAVNVAARLEQAAAPGEILLGETTYRLVRDAVEVDAGRAARSEGQGRAGAARSGSTCVLRGRRPATPATSTRRWSGATRSSRCSSSALERARRPSGRRTCSRCSGPPAWGSRGWCRSSSRTSGRGHGPARPMPVLRRGHHVLPARRDRPGGRAVSDDGRPRDRASEARRARRGRRGPRPDRRARRRTARVGRAGRRRGRVLGRPQALRAPRARTAARRACSTTSTGPSRAFLDLIEHLADWTRDAPILLAVRGPARAARDPPGLGRREAERHDDPAGAARRRRGLAPGRQPARPTRTSRPRPGLGSWRPPRATRCSSRRCSAC